MVRRTETRGTAERRGGARRGAALGVLALAAALAAAAAEQKPSAAGGEPEAVAAEDGAASTEEGAARRKPADDEAARLANLPREHREWLDQVALLITEEERDYFLGIEEEFRRWAFIDRFWEVRDPEPETAYNELKRRWEERVGVALGRYGTLEDDRARMLMTNGEPGGFVLPDGRAIDLCFDRDQHLEVWFYGGGVRTRYPYFAIFYLPERYPSGPYRIWYGFERLRARKRFQLPSTNPADFCEADVVADVIRAIATDRGYRPFIEGIMKIDPPASREWVATFDASTTDLPAGVETFPAELAVAFPGRNQNRTAVQGVVSVPGDGRTAETPDGGAVRRFLLIGEVIRDDRLLESFRYRFEVPSRAEGERLPLVFQRYLRPGEVELRLKVEDLLGEGAARLVRRLEVPSPYDRQSVRPEPQAEIFALLDEASAAAERGQTTLRIVPPRSNEIQLGGTRFHTVTTGEIDAVTFFLNGSPVLTKRRPPFSVELDLGSFAATHRLRAVGYDEAGEELASDELLVNRGGQRFRVRLTEPRADREYSGSLSAVAQVEVPEAEKLDRVEIYLDERRVATLYQPPFVQPILLEHDGLAYVRAVAYLADGLSTEDVVFVNAPEYFEQVDVVYVELYASVHDRAGRPILGLERDDFRVFEDGEEQRIRRFEFVRDLPFHAALMIDTSASMDESLDGVVEAARGFVEQALRPRDRVALFSFNARPEVEVRFTSSPEQVARELGSLRARGTTALYDSLVFTLQYFDGIRGQKALLLLSDGQDEASRFHLEAAVETARRAGVTIYVVGLAELARDRDAQKVLRTFAEETGGRSFFVDGPEELPEVYRVIQEELRSQYLLTYQSTSTKERELFRRVRVEVDRRGAEVRTLAGYYPP